MAVSASPFAVTLFPSLTVSLLNFFVSTGTPRAGLSPSRQASLPRCCLAGTCCVHATTDGAGPHGPVRTGRDLRRVGPCPYEIVTIYYLHYYLIRGNPGVSREKTIRRTTGTGTAWMGRCVLAIQCTSSQTSRPLHMMCITSCSSPTQGRRPHLPAWLPGCAAELHIVYIGFLQHRGAEQARRVTGPACRPGTAKPTPSIVIVIYIHVYIYITNPGLGPGWGGSQGTRQAQNLPGQAHRAHPTLQLLGEATMPALHDARVPCPGAWWPLGRLTMAFILAGAKSRRRKKNLILDSRLLCFSRGTLDCTISSGPPSPPPHPTSKSIVPFSFFSSSAAGGHVLTWFAVKLAAIMRLPGVDSGLCSPASSQKRARRRGGGGGGRAIQT